MAVLLLILTIIRYWRVHPLERPLTLPKLPKVPNYRNRLASRWS